MDAFCREASIAEGEPIAGTAVHVETWLVLEYAAAWAAKAFEASDLSEPVKDHLNGWLAELPRARIQLVRREGREPEGDAALYLASSRLGGAALAKYELSQYDDLRGIDAAAALEALTHGGIPTGASQPERPLVLVCTNGKRDRCCAKFGLPVYRRLAERQDLDVWQTTHLGGHRFASTLVVLPAGLSYGRLENGDAEAIAEAIADDRLYRLDRFRGRTCLPPPAQAAEAFARAHFGSAYGPSVSVSDPTSTDEHRFVVQVTVEGRAVEVELEHRAGSAIAPPSCGKDPVAVRGYTMLGLRDLA